MSNKSKKAQKNHLSSADREIGRNRIYLILGMIALGLAIAIYRLQ